MKFHWTVIAGIALLLLVTGCASVKVSDRHELVATSLPRPNTVWVYDFAATPEDVPAESALAGRYSPPGTPRTAEQLAADREVGAELAEDLVQRIRGMGMPAERAGPDTQPEINDIVIRGYLLSVVQGSEGKRVIIGFSAGESELKVAAEGFEMTTHGLRKLGSGETEATGAKTPGTAVGVLALVATHNPVGLIVSTGMKAYGKESGRSGIKGRVEQTAKEIADVLKKRFEAQGWIS